MEIPEDKQAEKIDLPEKPENEKPISDLRQSPISPQMNHEQSLTPADNVINTASTITVPQTIPMEVSIAKESTTQQPAGKNSFTDNGIFDFMSPEQAIDLYNRIHQQGIPELDWKFYGRRKLGDQEQGSNSSAIVADKDSEGERNENSQNQTVNTEFDFGDEDFGDSQIETSLVNDSLRLKKRESGVEKKTNLSDIMSDIMKESHTENQ